MHPLACCDQSQDIEDCLSCGLEGLKDYLRMRELKAAMESKRESMDSGFGEESDTAALQV
jgi:hypothetical protein